MGAEGAPDPVVFTAPVSGLYELNLRVNIRPQREQCTSTEIEEK